MNSFFSTRQAARKLGIDPTTLSRYVAAGKVPAPKLIQAEGMRVHGWSEEEVEQVRQLLPKIANGRKTRYQKQRQKKEPKKKSKQ
jgi:predicted DNA-binding transcriptional regulator AlpA